MIRAAMINESTGIVENVIMATEEDFINRPTAIIRIPYIQSKDGLLVFHLGVARDFHKWDGSKFVDLDNNDIPYDEVALQRIADQNKLLETEQLPPEVI